jgi:hypothetical protein
MAVSGQRSSAMAERQPAFRSGWINVINQESRQL